MPDVWRFSYPRRNPCAGMLPAITFWAVIEELE